jgi:hypothetical protein
LLRRLRRGCDPHVAASNATESDVRIAVHVHNAFFITFVHGISVYPKPSRFGQIHTEPSSRRLAYCKFRILRGPIILCHKRSHSVFLRCDLRHLWPITTLPFETPRRSCRGRHPLYLRHPLVMLDYIEVMLRQAPSMTTLCNGPL